jgi:hypothetical protein
MTYRRLNKLLIGLLFLALAALITMPYCAHAEDWSYMAQAGVELDLADSMGWSPGVGVSAMVGTRWRFLELRVSGAYAYAHKKTATTGRDYYVDATLRGYFYDNFYGAVGGMWAGYWTYFGDEGGWAKKGTTWSKQTYKYHLDVGYNDGNTQVELSYSPREYSTLNQVETITLGLEQRLWKGLFGIVDVSWSWWNQGDERRNGPATKLGLAWRWEK